MYYASDIHGTEVLWKKFLNAPKVYGARVLVMGGDITGKLAIPIVPDTDGGYAATLFGRKETVATPTELDRLENRIRSNGMYPYRMTSDEVAAVAAMSDDERERWFANLIGESMTQWIALADHRLADRTVRCFVMPGNDDPSTVAEAIEQGSVVEPCDEKIVTFDGYSMASLGFSNRTPWNSPRELDEDELYARLSTLVESADDPDRLILNVHVPPFDSGLDMAPELDEDFRMRMVGGEPVPIPVGSTAVRETIEEYQPLLGIHGHVHESAGVTRIGKTLCVNPGSDYHTGRIAGCLLTLRDGEVRHQFVTG
jgi:Icc-related predicted phosphoesterase